MALSSVLACSSKKNRSSELLIVEDIKRDWWITKCTIASSHLWDHGERDMSVRSSTELKGARI